MLAASLPDPGSPDLPALFSIAAGFVLTAHAFWRGDTRGDVQWAGFKGAFIGAGVGLVVYGFGLLTGLY